MGHYDVYREHNRYEGEAPQPRPKLLALGVTLNLGNIAYFKYANFFVDNVNALANTTFSMSDIVLPLAISFFTFQQIAFLIDAYRRETREYDFLNYCLFVTYFPQLIAGPIVHHKEMMPQFSDDKTFRLDYDHLATGITIFCIGLFKKVVLADGIAIYATEIFGQAEAGASIALFAAWGGALAYTFQLYFDFSGYSDMAIGLARMMGIHLPINFNSPYKARNIVDFWRKWHMTLSRFLRDYLYIPLGGNQKGKGRRHINLLITMLLGGLWHGASWNFVIWGGLHGLYLVINNAWRSIGFSSPKDRGVDYFYRIACLTLTFIAVVFAWVVFRAPTLQGAGAMYSAMIGLNGVVLPEPFFHFLNYFMGLGNTLGQLGVYFNGTWEWQDIGQLLFLIGLGAIALFAPNVTELFALFGTTIRRPWQWARFDTRFRWVMLTVLMLGTSVLFIFSHRVSEFLYFQF